MTESAEQKFSGTRIKVLLLAIVLTVVLGVAGFVSWKMFFVKNSTESDIESTSENIEELSPEERIVGLAHAIGPMVINLKDRSFLKITIVLELEETANLNKFYSREHEIRDQLIEKFNTLESRDVLDVSARPHLKEEIQGIVSKATSTDVVKKVYFSELVIQ
jgi:flagellar basal body-associated protein FliL